MSDRPRTGFDPLRRRLLGRLAAVGGTLAWPLAGCGGGSDGASGRAAFRLAVLSDVHLFDTGALGDGDELVADLGAERRTVRESAGILDAALAAVLAGRPDALLVTGDLTKDGERANHEAFAARLAPLRAAGIRSFVLPGNHDVANPAATDYRTTPATRAASVTPAEFTALHADSGYAGAIARDPDSLSYVAELADGLWLLAVDSCRYGEPGATGPVSAGRVRAATMEWIDQRLAEARRLGVRTIAAMHHGLVEHFPQQATLFPDYLVADRAAIAARWVEAGLRVVFSGHFHAQDVVATSIAGATLHDVETGALVAAPSPYRLATVAADRRTLGLEAGRVVATAAHPDDYVDWSRDALDASLDALLRARLAAPPYALTPAQLDALLPLALPALAAHVAGDERLVDPEQRARLDAMAASPDPTTRQAAALILGLWTDAAPGDDEATLPLD